MTRNHEPRGLCVVVVGQGYVGLPLAVRAAEVGHHVVGLDVDAGRIKRPLIGESYVEDISDKRLAPLLAAGVYRPTVDPSDCAGFDVAVVTVPTPLRDGAPDLSHVEEAARTLGHHLTRGATVVLESTTYLGTTEDVFRPLLEGGSGLTAGRDFHLGYSPERIDPGNPTWRLENTPKVVSGIDPSSLEAVRAFYASLVDRVVPVASCKEAELTKLLENTFRHVNIALANELAIFAHDLGERRLCSLRRAHLLASHCRPPRTACQPRHVTSQTWRNPHSAPSRNPATRPLHPTPTRRAAASTRTPTSARRSGWSTSRSCGSSAARSWPTWPYRT
ncbi:nucleotide sugar dehydrogenase [Streptomyces sp. AmelKG-A3]|nr:UDP-N-acetyl-D-glucosamine dehydrogenase [Streptomyces sp. PalvLS-984]SDD89754.1 nucleotide sugar dehydrogenase [Streptomyces sp. AmelKG-A3]